MDYEKRGVGVSSPVEGSRHGLMWRVLIFLLYPVIVGLILLFAISCSDTASLIEVFSGEIPHVSHRVGEVYPT